MQCGDRILAAFVVASWIVLTGAPGLAVRPVIVMFYGGGLTKAIFVKDTMVFHDLANRTSLRVSDFSDRKYLDVAAYWGAQWNPYYNGQKPLTELRPEQAGQHGRFYVATSSEPAVLLWTYPQAVAVAITTDTSLYVWGGILPDADVERLIKAGVPARLPR